MLLVGDFADGDSRVQKEARSAATAGWETYLIGRSPTGIREEYPLGGATVIRVAEVTTARGYQASHPRRGLRRRLSGRLRGTTRTWDAQPLLIDLEDSFGPVIDELAPDIVHAHGPDTLAPAARAVVRARAQGRPVKLVYDARELFPGEPRRGDDSWPAAMAREERRYLPLADGVCAATEPLATAMAERYGLPTPPTVVGGVPEEPDANSVAWEAQAERMLALYQTVTHPAK